VLNLFLAGQISLVGFLILATSLLLAISIHEMSHGLVAAKLGDQTAKLAGRLTLNPLSHLDPLGTFFLLVFGFGWGKPVPINPLFFKNIKRDSALVALAGPGSNFVMAILFSIVYRIINPNFGLIYSTVLLFIYFNLLLGLFNLLPFGPLDGFKVVGGLLPLELSRQWAQNELISLALLFAILILPVNGVPIINFILNPILRFFMTLLTGSPFA